MDWIIDKQKRLFSWIAIIVLARLGGLTVSCEKEEITPNRGMGSGATGGNNAAHNQGSGLTGG